MKKYFYLLVLMLLGSINEFKAQDQSQKQNSGLGFNYQAVARKADGVLLTNADVTLRISLYPGQSATTPTWVEIHNAHTDVFGSFGITVGKGTRASNSVAAKYADINFAAVYYWMKIELQEGDTFRELSFAQLPSTPYSEVAHNAAMFAGMIAPFAGPVDKIPDGWLLCDGRAVKRSVYLNLFNAIGVCWGEGDGSSTFNIPDLRGMFLRGVSGESGNDEDANSRGMLNSNGGNSGNNVGSYQGDAIRNIKWGCIFYATEGEKINVPAGFEPGYSTWTVFDISQVVPTGSDNRPKNVYVNYIIKY